MGGVVLPAPAISSARSAFSSIGLPVAAVEQLRFHAHCTKGANNGSVTLAFSNADEVSLSRCRRRRRRRRRRCAYRGRRCVAYNMWRGASGSQLVKICMLLLVLCA